MKSNGLLMAHAVDRIQQCSINNILSRAILFSLLEADLLQHCRNKLNTPVHRNMFTLNNIGLIIPEHQHNKLPQNAMGLQLNIF